MKNQDNQKSKIQILIELEALLNEQDLEKLEGAIYDLEPYLYIPEVVDALKSLLEGRALRTELVAIEVLGKTKSEDLIQILIAKLNNKNKWIKAAAIEALSELGYKTPEVIYALEKQFSDNGKNKDFITKKALVALKNLDMNIEQITDDLFNQLKSGLPTYSSNQLSKEYSIAYDALSNLVPVLKFQALLEIVEFLVIQEIETGIQSNIATFLKNIQEIQFMNLLYLMCDRGIIQNSSSMPLILDLFLLAKKPLSDESILEILKLFISIISNQEVGDTEYIKFHDAGVLVKLEDKFNDPLKFIVKKYLDIKPASYKISLFSYRNRITENELEEKKHQILDSLIKRVVHNYLNELIDILIDNNIVELIDCIEKNVIGEISHQNIPLIVDILLDKLKNSEDKKIKNLALKSLYKLIDRIPKSRFLEVLKHFLGSFDANIKSEVIANYIPEDKVSQVLDNLVTIIRDTKYPYRFNIELLFDLINKISDERFEELAEELSVCDIRSNLYKTLNNFSPNKFNILLNALLAKINTGYALSNLENLLDYYCPVEKAIQILNLLFHRASNREEDWVRETNNSYREHKQICDNTKTAVDKIIKYSLNTIKSDLFEFFIDRTINTDRNIQNFAFDKVKKIIEINQSDVCITNAVIEAMISLFSSNNYKKKELLEILFKIPNLLDQASKEQITRFIENIISKIQSNNCYNKDVFVEAIGTFSRHIPINMLNSIKELLLNLIIDLQNVDIVVTALEAVMKIDLVEHSEKAVLNNALSIIFTKTLDKNTEVKNIAAEILIKLNNKNPKILVNECLKVLLKQSVIRSYSKTRLHGQNNKNDINIIITNARTKIDIISKFTNIADAHNIVDRIKIALNILFQDVNSKEHSVRKAAIDIINDFVEYIPKSNVEKVFNKLIMKLDDKNPQVRIASIKALTQLASKNKEFVVRVLNMLMNKIADKAKEVEQVVQKAIPSLVENLQESLQHNDDAVIFNWLISRFDDNNPQIKIIAINILTQLVLKNQEFTTPALDKLTQSFEYENVEVMALFLKAMSLFIKNSQESSVNKIFNLLLPLSAHKDYKVRNLSRDAILQLGLSHQKFKFLTIIQTKFSSKILSNLTVPLDENYKISDEIIELLTTISKTEYDNDERSSIIALDILSDNIPEARMFTVIDFLMSINAEVRNLILKLINNQAAIDILSSHFNSNNSLVKKYAEELSLLMHPCDNKSSKLSSELLRSVNKNEDLLIQKTNLLDLETTIEEIATQDLGFTQTLEDKYGIKVNNVASDGNCFFHAVEEQLKLINNGEAVMRYEQIREFALSYISTHRDEFRDFMIDETIDQYLDRMSQDGQWVDHNFVQAISRELQINIVIISSNHVDMPQVIGSTEYNQTIYLGHIVELHYVSLERITDNQTANQNFLDLESKVEQELLSLNTGSNEQKENSVDNGNDLTVLNVESLYENEILNHPTLLKQIYDLAGITTVNLFIDLGKNKDVAEQITEAINQLATEKVLEILFGNNFKALESEFNSNLILKQKSDTAHDINESLLSTSTVFQTDEEANVILDIASVKAAIEKSNNNPLSWVNRCSDKKEAKNNYISL